MVYPDNAPIIHKRIIFVMQIQPTWNQTKKNLGAQGARYLITMRVMHSKSVECRTSVNIFGKSLFHTNYLFEEKLVWKENKQEKLTKLHLKMCILFKDFSYSLQVTRIRDDGAHYGKNRTEETKNPGKYTSSYYIGFDMNSKINKESL